MRGMTRDDPTLGQVPPLHLRGDGGLSQADFAGQVDHARLADRQALDDRQAGGSARERNSAAAGIRPSGHRRASRLSSPITVISKLPAEYSGPVRSKSGAPAPGVYLLVTARC